jgi:hypothetical protein
VTRSSLVPLVVLMGVLVAGCGVETEPTAVAPRTSSPAKVAVALRPATGTPVVTLRGRLNGGRPLRVDLASLDALPSRRLTVLEPFVKKTVRFEGVGFTDLLDAAGATGTSVTVHALDDYEVTFRSAVLRDEGALLATQADGRPIGLDDGGPVRLVFPASSKTGQDTDLWVWSIDSMSVE